MNAEDVSRGRELLTAATPGNWWISGRNAELMVWLGNHASELLDAVEEAERLRGIIAEEAKIARKYLRDGTAERLTAALARAGRVPDADPTPEPFTDPEPFVQIVTGRRYRDAPEGHFAALYDHNPRTAAEYAADISSTDPKPSISEEADRG